MLHVESGETVELMDCGGLLLGVNAGAQYREQRVLLGPGDVLALTPDGRPRPGGGAAAVAIATAAAAGSAIFSVMMAWCGRYVKK